MDEIRRELLRSHPCDLPAIRRYVTWVQFRRAVHNTFYYPAHWVRPVTRVHWVGQ